MPTFSAANALIHKKSQCLGQALTNKIKACGPFGPPQKTNESVTDVVGQFVTYVPVRSGQAAAPNLLN